MLRPGGPRVGRCGQSERSLGLVHADGPTVEQFCNRIHKGLMEQFKYAWVWGSSVRHQPQRVGKDHVLHDEDVIQMVKKV